MQIDEVEVISHHFYAGVYCKLVRIPNGYHVVTHKHEFDHMSLLMEGCVIVEADGVQSTHYAPDVINIKSGVAHEVIAVNGDATWSCVHSLHNVQDNEMWHPDKIDVALIEAS